MTTRAPIGAAMLVVLAAISQEVGAAFAVGLFAAVGTVGALFARFAVAGVILCAAARPTVRGLTRRAWGSAVALAATLAVMNFCFYLAIARIPLGIAVTIEALGPLILSVVTSSRRIAWLWALLAFSGVALLGLPRHGGGHFDPMGFAFAAAAGLAWACYILASARTAAEFRRVDGLALATAMGAIVVAPFAAASVHLDALHWHVLGIGAAVGVLSSVIPYSLELISLRRLPPATFAVLTCLSPVTAALAGLVVLGQQIGLLGYLGVALVTVASIGAVRSAHAGPIEPLG
ncbi:integral membrane protein [Mycolicibacterium mageritense DSM 44476 = CIP 104973]|uniref:Membrane protein n=1 Tax=Mycolicibacterium mageritense TaxID=53462 RepID=A0ABN5YBU6_MYCME|nr:EamA family transporter [Mycolicibacterium mageritense]MCC9181013.1 EamA family transporter [Mycolicibacterium mageritense]BBX35100.1 membrane protein [Mycolicibacterium mageritense]CDO20386.1 integral membrane protein [Mycolicibacterium mageritense DSM 44476 = CIP 104973]